MGLSFSDKLGLVVGNFAAPGFAQAVLGKRRAALIWAALVIVPALLGTLSVWLVTLSLLVHVAALLVAIAELHRLRRGERQPLWWSALSIAVLVIGIGSYVFLRATLESFKIPSSSMYPTLQIGDYVYVDKLSLQWHAPERGEVIVFDYPCAPDRQYIKRVIALAGDTVEIRCDQVYVNGTAVPAKLVQSSKDCRYKDYDEQERRWFERECSRYAETANGHTYEVFQDPERPEREQAIAAGNPPAGGSSRDFPLVGMPFPPSCSQAEYSNTPTHPNPVKGTLVETKPAATAAACEPQLHYVVPPHSLFVVGDNRFNANDSRVWGALSADAVIGRVVGIWLTHPPGESPSFGRVGSIE